MDYVREWFGSNGTTGEDHTGGPERGSSSSGLYPVPAGFRHRYIGQKDSGHRGPSLGVTLVDGRFISTVTPTCVTVISAANGGVCGQLYADTGDAYTVAVSATTSLKNGSGWIIGTQSGCVSLISMTVIDSKSVTVKIESTIPYTRDLPITSVCAVPHRGIAWGASNGEVQIFNQKSDSNAIFKCESSCTVTAIVAVSETSLWIGTDTVGIIPLAISGLSDAETGVQGCRDGDVEAPIVSNVKLSLELDRRCQISLTYDGMNAVTFLEHCKKFSLIVCLSAHSEVSLWNTETFELVHKYPAGLMTCGVPLSALRVFDRGEENGQSYLLLGGLDGSLCLRKFSLREKDGRIQCVLLRCMETLDPETVQFRPRADADDGVPGCPVSTISYVATNPGDLALVADASCDVYVVRLGLDYAATVDIHSGVALQVQEQPAPLPTMTFQRAPAPSPVIEEP